MMLTIISSPKIELIRLYGSFNASNAIELQRQMKKAVTQEDPTNVLVDMEEVESIDSNGLMALVYSLRLAQALECRFSLCCVSPSIRMIFELTQLDEVFEIFNSKAEFEAAIANKQAA